MSAGRVQTGILSFTANEAMDRYLRVKLSGGKVTPAGATEEDVGTLTALVLAADDECAVIPPNMDGSVMMVASEAITQYTSVYGAAGGKVSDTSNANFIGIALTASTGDGSEIEVLRQVAASELDQLSAIDGNLVVDDDFIGDWPAAGTALGGEGPAAWTKVETNGLGVISSDEVNGVIKFSADAVAEAATAALYMINAPFDIDKNPVVEFILGVFDIGDNAALDINFGMADDTHATDADLIGVSAFFHLDGNDLSLKLESDDGTAETAATDTTVDLVDDTYYAFKIDFSDKADVKFFYRAINTGAAWIALLPGTTFDMSNHAGALTPIVHVEKTSNDTTFDVRVDRIRVQCERN